ncbi:threonine synthase [Alphaproteobacteria bacterium]|nr:threonine synthase [Alphaproteobacteria bacterium]
MKYISTRGGGEPQTFEQVLLTGLAPDGGLYVPMTWPQLDLVSLKGKSYTEIAFAVMYPYVEGSIPENEFRAILEKTYANFRHEKVVPLHKLKDNLYTLELFHGPTIAFKDVALQLLGQLFDYVLTRRDEQITIVGATSGDTGSAAIEGCYHSDRTNIFILFPNGRVSDVQRKQMTTVDAPNVHCLAVEGTFDDCQSAVKEMFNDAQFRNEMNLSAVNSINWARIMAQIVYYVTTAIELDGQDITFVVPTGNFGNVYAAHCARQMGVPIKKLVIATNKNDILTRFFETGEMKMGGVDPTISPSMDIQISSNFERYLFDILGRDSEDLTSLMNQFKTTGHFVVPDETLQKALKGFRAGRANDEETLATIKQIHADHDYTLDPHTAVGMKVALERAAEEEGAIISLACAHPAKFPDAVEKAIGSHPKLPEHLADLFEREEKLDILPNDLEKIQTFIKEKSNV